MPVAASTRQAHHIAAYLTDRLVVGDNLAVDLGLRFRPIDRIGQGASRSIAWAAVLPRFSFRWTPSVATVFGGYGRYQSDVSLDLLAFGDPGEPATDVTRWTDANANGRFDPGRERRAGRARRAWPERRVHRFLPCVRRTLMSSFSAAERALGQKMRLGASAVVRPTHDLGTVGQRRRTRCGVSGAADAGPVRAL